ncbi:MAG: recombinase family protein [Anaerovoracaceae bacterium]
MNYFAYHRVSTKNQKLDRGIDEINKFCESKKIELRSPPFTDKQTGKDFDRPRYTVLKEDVLREGDILIITEIDRLGRNKLQILEELSYFKKKGVRVMILELPTTLVDMKTESTINTMLLETVQNMLIELYACLAEGELEKKNKRQAEGIEAMKNRGDWARYGRPKALEWQTFIDVYGRVLNGTTKPFEAIKALNISQPTYYRYKKQYETEQQLSRVN